MITPAHGDGKGRREYAYTPERPSAVFLLGCTRHRNGDRGCEPFHLNVVARMGASSVYRAQNPAVVAPGGVLLLTLARGSRGSAPSEPLSEVPKSLGGPLMYRITICRGDSAGLAYPASVNEFRRTRIQIGVFGYTVRSRSALRTGAR